MKFGARRYGGREGGVDDGYVVEGLYLLAPITQKEVRVSRQEKIDKDSVNDNEGR